MLAAAIARLTTAAELRQVSQIAKTQVLARIMAHFAAHPDPVAKMEEVDGQLVPGNLLDYQVATRKYDEASLIEFGPEGYTYEPTVWSDTGGESYQMQPLAVLLDVLDVLENSVVVRAGEPAPRPRGKKAGVAAKKGR